eukprot:gnl/MRDRNA2_/MRDRNA2_267290_c0_seq1.p2 gnl/MRDRNA2_/MRDRNA2_267290_c0~~gnl/MRDRNA2_/MRDRNA2_267290_c0_seq1.p2  ORF type:complete len:103 (+),score=20.86 gnl/MRDRNA2_/MRDRNA2_267290_c0_seq1:607-915(+)
MRGMWGGLPFRSFLFLEHRDVCGQCHKVDRQDDIVRCCTRTCVGDEEAMFHSQCMHKIKDDIYMCIACFAAGNEPESEDEDSEECDDSQEEDEDEAETEVHS